MSAIRVSGKERVRYHDDESDLRVPGARSIGAGIVQVR